MRGGGSALDVIEWVLNEIVKTHLETMGFRPVADWEWCRNGIEVHVRRIQFWDNYFGNSLGYGTNQRHSNHESILAPAKQELKSR
jgi:hypothetical protein